MAKRTHEQQLELYKLQYFQGSLSAAQVARMDQLKALSDVDDIDAAAKNFLSATGIDVQTTEAFHGVTRSGHQTMQELVKFIAQRMTKLRLTQAKTPELSQIDFDNANLEDAAECLAYCLTHPIFGTSVETFFTPNPLPNAVPKSIKRVFGARVTGLVWRTFCSAVKKELSPELQALCEDWMDKSTSQLKQEFRMKYPAIAAQQDALRAQQQLQRNL